jgi:hypothetical protein
MPELEPVPREHVLTKTFYLLLRDFPGRFTSGQTWVETLPRDRRRRAATRPARGGDGVSPIIITSNDLAGAWAMRPDGQPMLPLTPGEPRQREFAFRAGVNIVMYVLTGNYKADQVHAPGLDRAAGAIGAHHAIRHRLRPAGPAARALGGLRRDRHHRAMLLFARTRGAAVRVAALALILLALANPSFTREDREPLSSVAAVVIDRSPSQNFGNRNSETAQAQEALVNALKQIKGLDVRVVEAGQADGETDGTKLFSALSSALSDVPPSASPARS